MTAELCLRSCLQRYRLNLDDEQPRDEQLNTPAPPWTLCCDFRGEFVNLSPLIDTHHATFNKLL